MIRRLAMVDRAEHQIGCALQRRSFCRDAGGRARLADKTAVGLRIFVDAVATQRQERRPWRHFAFPLIKPAQEGAATVELVAEAFVPIEDAVVGRAAQHGVADVRSPAVLDMVANGIAAARIADQSHARRAGAALQFLDGVGEFAALILRRGFVRLRLGIVGSRQGIGEIDREHALARNAVGFHPPQRRDPQGRLLAMAVGEQDRRNFAGARAGSRCLRKGRKPQAAGCQRQGSGALQ